ncbi:MAG: PP2C family protein-serine/threonine phosphatase [Thermodesulfobacteriota bacterium]
MIDALNGKAKIAQAGHPSPICNKFTGEIHIIGRGGFPIGMFPDAEYEEIELSFDKGDRLVLYSDGITECLNDAGESFTDRRLIEIIRNLQNQPLEQLINDIEHKLSMWNGGLAFKDDISLLAIEKI